jgi:hypothetical protein
MVHAASIAESISVKPNGLRNSALHDDGMGQWQKFL